MDIERQIQQLDETKRDTIVMKWMGSYSMNKEPFVAKEDIKVFKPLYIEQDEKGEHYHTLYMCANVGLCTMMDSEKNPPTRDLGSKPHLLEDEIGNKLLMDGFIHSYLHNVYPYLPNAKTFVATIPKGTKYYVDNDLREIASERLYVSDVDAGTSQNKFLDEENEKLLEPISSKIDVNKVCPGWLYLKDGTFIHPSEYTENDVEGIIGVVVLSENVNETHCKLVIMKLDDTVRHKLSQEEIVKLMEPPVNGHFLSWELPTYEICKRIAGETIDVVNYSLLKVTNQTLDISPLVYRNEDGLSCVSLTPFITYEGTDISSIVRAFAEYHI